MAKALFFSLPLHGHVNPSLPLVRELVRRGEQVVYYGTEPVAAGIRGAGATYRPYRDAFLSELCGLPAQTDALPWLLMSAAARVIHAELETCRADRPDYVITDSVAPWDQWIGAILGLPVVTSISTFAVNRCVLSFGLRRGVRPKSASAFASKLRHMGRAWLLHRRLSRGYGVRGPGVMRSVFGTSPLNIVYTPRFFQPCAETFDDGFAFIGPMTTRTETAAFPWERVGSDDLIYISLGTLFNDDAAFYTSCFEAFAGEPVQVILSLGTNVDIDRLAPVPSNFIVASHVPQLAVLRRVKAFVSHGGMNSVSESLACGVPLVVVPQMSEQTIVGRRVEQLEAGLFLTRDQARAASVREAVRSLLVDERFRRGATAVRRSFDEAGGVGRGADAIVGFARGAPC